MLKDIEQLISLAKRRGFIFPGSEIYGGLANSWDYGPLGVELKNNIKQAWWRMFVQQRGDMVGIDAALIMNPKVWEASGHLKNFTDPLAEDKISGKRYRADSLIYLGTAIEDMEKRNGESVQIDMPKVFKLVIDYLKSLFKEDMDDIKNIKSLDQFLKVKNLKIYYIPEEEKIIAAEAPRAFNMMLKTHLGPVEDRASVVYFRPETAQAMFVDFKLVLNATRQRIRFGIAQIGKAFRNEITPGNYIFRTREFEQMEIEYFISPSVEGGWEKQFDYWLEQMKKWMEFLGLKSEHIHFREIPDGERAHYSKRTIDIDYDFPFGTKELYGIAYRTDFDLKNHQEASKEDMNYTDPITNEKFIPHVIEPTFGVDRSVLAVLVEHYDEEDAPTSEKGETEKRIVLRLPKYLAPIKIAVLPLSKKPELEKISKPIADELRKHFMVNYDETQSIGKRYRRQDEIGTPYCITVDFDSLDDKKVTVRERDSMKQERIAINELTSYFLDKFNS